VSDLPTFDFTLTIGDPEKHAVVIVARIVASTEQIARTKIADLLTNRHDPEIGGIALYAGPNGDEIVLRPTGAWDRVPFELRQETQLC